MKKQLSVLLALLFVLSSGITAMAAETIPGCSYISASQAHTEVRAYETLSGFNTKLFIFPEGTTFSFVSDYPVMAGGGLTAYDPSVAGDVTYGPNYAFYSYVDGDVFYPENGKVYHLVASADTMSGQDCYIMLEGKAESQPAERPSAWAEEKVAYGIETGIVPQSLQSAYGNAATRAEFCALAVGLYEKIKGEIAERAYFTDTQDVNVEKMAAVGVVNGVGDGRFDPSAPLTRQEAATMLCRLAEAAGKPLENALPDFEDKALIASWAESSVGSMQASGVMDGVGGGMFAPTDPYTREQSIVTVMRLYDVIG